MGQGLTRRSKFLLVFGGGVLRPFAPPAQRRDGAENLLNESVETSSGASDLQRSPCRARRGLRGVRA